jgi:hypothetical protein
MIDDLADRVTDELVRIIRDSLSEMLEKEFSYDFT